MSFSLKLSSVTNRLSFSEQKVCTSAKSRREREGGDEVCTDSRQQEGQSVHVDRIDKDQVDILLIMLKLTMHNMS